MTLCTANEQFLITWKNKACWEVHYQSDITLIWQIQDYAAPIHSSLTWRPHTSFFFLHHFCIIACLHLHYLWLFQCYQVSFSCWYGQDKITSSCISIHCWVTQRRTHWCMLKRTCSKADGGLLWCQKIWHTWNNISHQWKAHPKCTRWSQLSDPGVHDIFIVQLLFNEKMEMMHIYNKPKLKQIVDH